MQLKHLFLITLIFVSAATAYAQKLPVVQQASVRAPSTVKIDGKPTEWDGQFQAHNNSTNVSYTLANDDDNLYLVVQAKDPRVIEKILMVGVTLVVNKSGKKSDKATDNVAITYPILKFGYVRGILVSAGDKANWSGLPANIHFQQTLTRTDSTVMNANKVFNNNARTIKIIGGYGLDDTLASVYNEQGIKAAALFDNNGLYTYELAMPFKYIGLAITDPKFSYSIKLSDWGYPMFNSSYSIRDPATGERGPQMDGDPDLNSTTEFWAEYTLAKNNE